MTLKEMRLYLDMYKARGAWKKGVKAYAEEFLDKLEENGYHEFNATEIDRKRILNGAEDWQEYSESGSALIYDMDIIKRLCSPGEIRLFASGRRHKPNKYDTWIDIQARALRQAYDLLVDVHEGRTL